MRQDRGINMWILASSVTLLLGLLLTIVLFLVIEPHSYLGLAIMSVLPGTVAGWVAYHAAFAGRNVSARWWIPASTLIWSGIIWITILTVLR